MKILRYDTDVEEDRSVFMADPGGYFTISMTPNKGQIALCHMLADDSPGDIIVLGTNGDKIRHALDELFPLTTSHALYLGAEIEKALMASAWDIPYTQDEPLPLWQVIPHRA
jgi:hypothetical protein